MAEPVSSIITIATLGLAIVRGCANFIESVREVDVLIDRIREEVTRLHRMVRYINSAYHKVGPDESSEPSILVRDKITLCRNRLREIKPKVVHLISQSSETVMEKTLLKLKVDEAAKDIEIALQDIKNSMADINTVLNCWTFQVAHHTHRDPEVSHRIASEVPSQQVLEVEKLPLDLRQPRVPSVSYPSSMAEDDLASSMRSNSTTEFDPRRPILRPSQSSFDDTVSISSTPSSTTSRIREDWQSFHSKVSRCMDEESRVEEIRSILQQASDSAALANIAGDCQRVPLHLAAQRGFVRVASVLVEFGAVVDAKDTEPSTVLDHALTHKRRDFVAFLLANDVDETAILPRNIPEFTQTKRIIAETKRIQGLQSARRDSVASNESRRFSLSFRRKQ